MTSTGRPRGSIRERGATLQVRVFAGYDAVTGKQRYLTESITGTDRAARRRAEKSLTRLQAQVDKQRAPETSVSLARALDEWLATNEIEDTTRRTYVGYIERTIKPATGTQPIDRLNARTLESLYRELRRCRTRCDNRPQIEKHTTTGDHDCGKARCKPHVCRPMAASTVRQMHSIISGTLTAAVRWEWIDSNPARVAQRPRAKAAEPVIATRSEKPAVRPPGRPGLHRAAAKPTVGGRLHLRADLVTTNPPSGRWRQNSAPTEPGAVHGVGPARCSAGG